MIKSFLRLCLVKYIFDTLFFHLNIKSNQSENNNSLIMSYINLFFTNNNFEQFDTRIKKNTLYH